MGRDDRDDPFRDIFDEIERLIDGVSDGVEDRSGFASETHVDVQETDGKLRVVADLPGVDNEAVELKCDGEVLTIRARSERREYDERIRLPTRVDEHSADASFNNGVLEVTFETIDSSADIDVS